MTPATPSLAPALSPALPATGYVGEVVYLYAFDVAYEMSRKPVGSLLGQPLVEYQVGTSKRSPKQLSFYRPQMVRLPPVERNGPRGTLRVERSVKLLSVGAISITVRVPLRVNELGELVSFHDLRFSDGKYLYDEVRQLAEDVRREMHLHYARPVDQLGDEEAYTVFCIHSPVGNEMPGDGQPVASAEEWFQAHRRDIAALLTEEPDVDRLSEQEAIESTSRYFSYYDRDLAIIDWDAALVADEPQFFDETLYIVELANVQLAELEAYDRILDNAVERSYRDLASRKWRGGWQRTGIQKELREIRIDLARLSDELSNITKFFGDFHLARLYQGLSARFHLGDWHRAIDEKLKTLDDLYGLLKAEQNNRWMLVLEVSIVFLFIIDLVILALGR
jgi:hypothetical protein